VLDPAAPIACRAGLIYGAATMNSLRGTDGSESSFA
jgi:hypothetical protein